MDAMQGAPKIGKTIKRARERKRLSQAEAAGRLGVSRSALNAWENDRAYPRSSIGAIEELYGITIDEPEPEPVIPPSLLAQIRRTLPAEDQERVIAAIERTLSGSTPPAGEEESGPSRRAG